MKILLLSRAPLSYMAGIPVYCRSLYSNADSSVFITSVSSSLASKQRHINVFPHTPTLTEYVFPSLFVRKTFSFSLFLFFFLLFNIGKYDLIHVQHPDPLLELFILLYRFFNADIKYIVSWHASILHKLLPPVSSIYQHFNYLFLKHALFITTFTDSHSRVISSLYPSITTPIHNAPMPLPYESDYNKPRVLRKNHSPKLIFVGRLVKYKGLSVLFDSLEDINFPVELNVVGDGPLLPQLKRMVQLSHKLRSFHCIKFLGLLSESQKRDTFLASDALVLPSITSSEALGIVQVEAMSFGLPILNTDLQNGVNETAPDQICALTSPPNCTSSLSSNITRMFTDPELYTKLSTNCLSLSQRHNPSFCWASFYQLISTYA